MTPETIRALMAEAPLIALVLVMLLIELAVVGQLR